MEYRVRTTGEIKTKATLIAENANVSFPTVWTNATLDYLDVDVVNPTPIPAASGPYVSVVRNGAELIDGLWYMAWTEVDMFSSQEEIDAYEAAEAAQRRSGQRCTARQARLALASNGSLEAIEAAVAAQGGAAAIEWEYANEIERSSPLIGALAGGLGWTEEDLDALFELAVTL